MAISKATERPIISNASDNAPRSGYQIISEIWGAGITKPALSRYAIRLDSKEGSFTLAYPLSHPCVDGRKKSGNTGER